MVTVGRAWSLGSEYRYGFNGQEQDDAVYGNGNSNTAEFWQYDTRLGRRWNTDPKPIFGISPYSVLKGNPLANVDFYGDLVSYANLKSRVAVFMAKQSSDEYKNKFNEMKADNDNTFNFNYHGDNGLSKETTSTYNLPADAGGFVVKEGTDTYTIHFTKQLNPGTIGYSKWGTLLEESFHVDDALGGKIFGGKNQSDLSFNDKNVLSLVRPAIPGQQYYPEVDAWIWKADNDNRPSGSILVTHPDVGTMMFRVNKTLMQQIHATKNLDYNERRNIVWGLLYESYTVNYQESVSQTDQGEPRKSFVEVQSTTGVGPYKPKN